jgi:hypothetical protein
MINRELTSRQVFIIELILIASVSVLPLLTQLPFRVNIFLTWEGAYRMFLGQVPFRDFGTPLGYGFWLIPFISFKVFGPYFYSLLIAQSFINAVSMLTLRGVLKLFQLTPVQILLSNLVFALSFVLINFWPWYNHTVFVYELIGFFFLLSFLLKRKYVISLVLSAFFSALCLVTKQDAGGLSLVFSIVLLVADAFFEKRYKPTLYFLLFYGISLAILIVPFLQYDFGYWFNYGQPPHFSRINLYDFISAFFEESLWIKLYLFIIVVIVFIRYPSVKEFLSDKLFLFYTLFTIGILVQALLIQVTSFSPKTVNYYFHAFGVAFLLFNLKGLINLERVWIMVLFLFMIMVWRSDNYWKYANRLLTGLIPSLAAPAPKNVVSRNTWASKDSVQSNAVIWKRTNYRSLRNMTMPENTIHGIERLLTADYSKNRTNLKVLNMTNLSFLAYEMNYELGQGQNYPLWYHKGVAFFDREEKLLCERVVEPGYDLILFESMPDVDNFFPYGVRACAINSGEYQLMDKFIAPTGYKTDSVEVYVSKRLLMISK